MLSALKRTDRKSISNVYTINLQTLNHLEKTNDQNKWISKICVNSGFDINVLSGSQWNAILMHSFQILEEFSNNFCTKEKTARDELWLHNKSTCIMWLSGS